jgi:hypothetical protein
LGAFSWDQTTVKNGVTYNASGSLDLNGTIAIVGKARNTDGLSVIGSTAIATDRNSTANKLRLALQFQQPSYTVEATADKAGSELVKVDASFTAKYDKITFGGFAGVLPQKTVKPEETAATKFTDYGVALRYTEPNYTFAINTVEKFQKIQIGYVQDVDANLSLALHVDEDLQTPKKPTFTVGNTYKIDAGSSVRAKINQLGDAAAAYRFQVNPRLTATVSAQTNVFDSSKGAKTAVAFEFNA